jgi:hemolysin III
VTATDSMAEPPTAVAFYDARRDVYYTTPALRGWLHLLWFEVSLVFGTLLLARAHGATRITASTIYAASVSGMFGISALSTAATGAPPGASACSGWITR